MIIRLLALKTYNLFSGQNHWKTSPTTKGTIFDSLPGLNKATFQHDKLVTYGAGSGIRYASQQRYENTSGANEKCTYYFSEPKTEEYRQQEGTIYISEPKSLKGTINRRDTIIRLLWVAFETSHQFLIRCCTVLHTAALNIHAVYVFGALLVARIAIVITSLTVLKSAFVHFCWYSFSEHYDFAGKTAH